MSGPVDPAQTIQVGIGSPQHSILIQLTSSLPPGFHSQGTPTIEDIRDITMMDAPPVSGITGDLLSHFREFLQDLLAKDPRTLTPDEVHLVSFLKAQAGPPQEEPERNFPQRSISVDDQVMRSPSPTHQTLTLHQQSSDSAGSGPHGLRSSDQRVLPGRAQRVVSMCRRQGPASVWQNSQVKKKGSTRSMCRKARQVRDKLTRETNAGNDNLCAEGESHQRSPYFTAAVEFINAAYQEELKGWMKEVRKLQRKVEKLNNTIKRRRREPNESTRRRDKQYLRTREERVQELQRATDFKDYVIQRHGEFLVFLQAAMEQDGQDFYTAWEALQAKFGLAPGIWPPGVPLPSATNPPSRNAAQPSASSSFVGTKIPSSSSPAPAAQSVGTGPASSSAIPSPAQFPPAEKPRATGDHRRANRNKRRQTRARPMARG